MFMRACFINEAVRRWLWGIHLHQRLRVPPGFPSFPREPVVSLLQLGAPTLCLRKRTPQSHLLNVGCCTCLIDRFINEAVRRWLWGIHLLQRLRVPPGYPCFPRMPVVMLLQLGAPTLCLRKRTPQSHLLNVGCCTCLIDRFINEAVRRWLWGIHLLQRLRVPPGFPSFPRMPVVMLLQLGAPTLGLRKRTPQSHLLWVGCCTYFLVSYRSAYLDFLRHV